MAIERAEGPPEGGAAARLAAGVGLVAVARSIAVKGARDPIADPDQASAEAATAGRQAEGLGPGPRRRRQSAAPEAPSPSPSPASSAKTMRTRATVSTSPWAMGTEAISARAKSA